MTSWLRSRRCCSQLVKIKEVPLPVGSDQEGAVASWIISRKCHGQCWLRSTRCCGPLVKIMEVLRPVDQDRGVVASWLRSRRCHSQLVKITEKP